MKLPERPAKPKTQSQGTTPRPTSPQPETVPDSANKVRHGPFRKRDKRRGSRIDLTTNIEHELTNSHLGSFSSDGDFPIFLRCMHRSYARLSQRQKRTKPTNPLDQVSTVGRSCDYLCNFFFFLQCMIFKPKLTSGSVNRRLREPLFFFS